MPEQILSDEDVGIVSALSDEAVGLSAPKLELQAPRQPYFGQGEMPTTVAGVRAPVASFKETMAEPMEMELNPRVTLPRFAIQENESPTLQVGKEALNILASVPEFFTSNLGIQSILASKAAPGLVSTAFTADMLHTLGQQVRESYKNWDSMTPTQKRIALTDMAGTGVFAGLAAAHAKGSFEPGKIRVTRALAEQLGKPAYAPIDPEQLAALGGRPIVQQMTPAEVVKAISPKPEAKIAPSEPTPEPKPEPIAPTPPAEGAVPLSAAPSLTPEESAVEQARLAAELGQEKEPTVEEELADLPADLRKAVQAWRQESAGKPVFRFLDSLTKPGYGDVFSETGEKLNAIQITPEQAKTMVGKRGGELIHGAILGSAKEAEAISKETGILIEQKQLPPAEAIEGDYVYHATTPRGAEQIRKSGIVSGSWFAKTPREAIGNLKERTDSPVVFAVKKSELESIPADPEDIFGQEFQKSGIYIRSGKPHTPVSEVEKYGDKYVFTKPTPPEPQPTVPAAGKAEVEKAKGGEPWQMTKAEIVARDKALWGEMSTEQGQHAMLTAHRKHVADAIREGLPVPPEVLADYPSLVKVHPAVLEQEAQPTVPAAGKAEGGVSAPPAPAIPEGGISPSKVQEGERRSVSKAFDVEGKQFEVIAKQTDIPGLVRISGVHRTDVARPEGGVERTDLMGAIGSKGIKQAIDSVLSEFPDAKEVEYYRASKEGQRRYVRVPIKRPSPTPTSEVKPTEAPPTLTPAESNRLKSLTEKMESGKPLTPAEQKRYRALKDKVSPPEGEKGEVQAGTEATEISGLRKADVKADPRLEMPGITKKSKPNSLIVALRDLDSVPVRELVLKSTGDPIQDAKVAATAIRRESGSGRISLRESLAVSTGPNGRAIYKFDTHPSGSMTWAKAQDWIDLVESRKPPTTPPSTGEGMVGPGAELQMAIVPGLKEFVEQDLVPFAKEVGQTIAETGKQMKALASPPTMGPEASLAAGIIREHKAKLAQTDVQMREKFDKNRKEFDSMSPQASLAFIDRMERGGVQPSTPLHQLQADLRTEFDKRVAQVRALGTGKLQHLIQDYFPHIWKDPNAAVSWYARILGKRPLKGPASFLKQRTIPLTVDGVQAGLEPVSWNPVDLSLLKFHEMDRYVMGQKIFQEFKDKGLAQFSRSDIAPPGFARIDDRVANVIEYRPTVKKSGAPGAPERVLRGHWYVQEDAARVLNNFLSPGLDRYKWFRAIRWIGNTMNMAQLGFSGYHFNFTMIDSGTSKLSLGLEQVARGELKGAAKSAQGLVPAVNQLEYYLKGNKVLQEYTKPGSVGNEYAKIVDALLASGGRVEMPRIFKNSSLENFFKAARTGNYPGAIVRAPFAALEAVSYPLMQNIVPRLKLGVFSDMALAEIDRMGPNVSRDEYRARLGKIWDSVDNRMGEMVYDNLFWNRNLKDLSFLAVRAVGWNLGTIRELGGGVMDAATVIGRVRRGDPVVTRRMAYVMALPVTVGLMGAMYQYAKTGQGPQEMRDYFYPKTGKTLPDGTPERVNFPSYLKDIASYGMHPIRTVANKLHPLWSEVAQMLENKDYYGQQIRNPDDPLVKQVQEEMAFVAKNFVPFSVRGAERRVAAKESAETKAESFFGVMPISPEIARTPAQNKIMEYARAKAPSGGRTPEEQERSEFTRDIEAQLQAPKDYAKTQQGLIQAQREGKLTRGQRLYQQNKLRFERMEMDRGHSKAQAQWLWRFDHLPLDQAQHVYDISTPFEKQLFKRALDLKIRRARQPQPTE